MKALEAKDIIPSIAIQAAYTFLIDFSENLKAKWRRRKRRGGGEQHGEEEEEEEERRMMKMVGDKLVEVTRYLVYQRKAFSEATCWVGGEKADALANHFNPAVEFVAWHVGDIGQAVRIDEMALEVVTEEIRKALPPVLKFVEKGLSQEDSHRYASCLDDLHRFSQDPALLRKAGLIMMMVMRRSSATIMIDGEEKEEEVAVLLLVFVILPKPTLRLWHPQEL